jgi:hypothetical protein
MRNPNAEPQIVPYRTLYGGRMRRITASDKYNAAVGRARKDSLGLAWTFESLERDDAGNEVFVVVRGTRKRRIRVL